MTLIRRYHGNNITQEVGKFESMFTGHLGVLERFFAQHENYRFMRNKAFAKVNFDYGAKYHDTGSYSLAFAKYFTCLRYDPLYVESYRRLLKLLLPRHIFALWSMAKKSLRSNC